MKVNLSTFVPKVATPFVWAGQDSTDEIDAKVASLRRTLHGRGLDLRWSNPRTSQLEAALGRGDRRLNSVVREAWQHGARFDAWDEHFDFAVWLEAFRGQGLDPAWYAQREIALAEALPWEHLDCGVSREYMTREYRRALEGKTSTDCHWGPCYKCGVPDATGFECDTGRQGPRSLLLMPEIALAQTSDQTSSATLVGSKVDASTPRWRYVGPPGDPRRSGWPPNAKREPASNSAVGSVRSIEHAGTEQSKDAGLSGLASLVEAAGGETSG